MTQTGYSNALVNLMLGWLKGLANWVLKLFNLAGSGGNPLLWLSENWLKLLIFFLVLGVALDWLVWMIRWRPYWVWFRKKRIVVNDEKFLSKNYAETDPDDDTFEVQYVVPSTVVRRQPQRKPVQTAVKRKPAAPERTRSVRRKADAQRPSGGRTDTAAVKAVRPKQTRPVQAGIRKAAQRETAPDELFEVGNAEYAYSDFYEDEVFNVSSLPDHADAARKNRKRHR